MAYLFLKDVHSILRWVVILVCLWAVFRAWSGFLGKKAWSKPDQVSGLIFSSLLNLQLLLGIVLYFISPFTRAALVNFGGAMKDGTLRFFAVEHPLLMILATVSAQVGYSLSKRTSMDRTSFLRAGIAYTLSALLILAAIPWPFLKYGRPLLPGLGAP